MEDADEIVAWGLRCADASKRVATPDGSAWLIRESPTLREVVKQPIAETLASVEAGFPGEDLW